MSPTLWMSVWWACTGTVSPALGETDPASETDETAETADSGDAGETADSGGDTSDTEDTSDTSDTSDTGDTSDTNDTDVDCANLATFDEGIQPTSTLHVATNGNDDTGNGSSGQPFASLVRAIQEATPGTAIQLHPGTYSGGLWIENLSGTAQAPIWIGGDPSGARPVIQGGAEAMHLVASSYLVIHDLEVRNTSDNGINADDGGDYDNPQASHGLVFRNLYIHGVGSSGNEDCLKLSGVNEFAVLDSEFTDCGGEYASAVDMVGCHDGVVANNQFHDLAGIAVQAKGGSSSIDITRNGFLNAGVRALNLGGSTDLEYFRPPVSTSQPNAEARDLRVHANVFVYGDAPIAFVGCVGCLVANNTIVDPNQWVIRILQETTSSGNVEFEPTGNNRFVNNVVWYNAATLSTHVNVGDDTAPATFDFAYNLWYAHDNPATSEPDLPNSENNALYGQDPDFGADWTIGGGSPAAGAGTAIGTLGADFSGSCWGNPPSMGAYEAN